MDEDLPECSRRNVQQYELVEELMPVQFSSSGSRALDKVTSLVRKSEIRAPSGRTRDLLSREMPSHELLGRQLL